jgi:hypothetical protein
MWVSRLHYESLFENLTRSRQELSDAKGEVRMLLATQSWLTTHVNRLEHERNILTQARLGLSFPVPVIEREEQAPPGIDPGSVHGTPDESIPLAQAMAATMEDVGDDQARALGMEHDELGHVIYKR